MARVLLEGTMDRALSIVHCFDRSLLTYRIVEAGTRAPTPTGPQILTRPTLTARPIPIPPTPTARPIPTRLTPTARRTTILMARPTRPTTLVPPTPTLTRTDRESSCS